MKARIALFLTCLMTTPAIASDVDVPNSFTAGAPAVAAAVNANFDAVETAVNDNHSRIASLESGLANAGVGVSVDGALIGRFIAVIPGVFQADVPPLGSGNTELVSSVDVLVNAPFIQVVSNTGYFLRIATGPVDGGRLNEGDLDTGPIFYDSDNCTGNMYMAIEGPSGSASTFTPGVSDRMPLKRWYARQGFVFQAPDPNDPNTAYMLRRGADVVQTPLRSLRIWSAGLGAPFCVDMANFPDYDPNDPMDVEHSAVPLEVWDPAETGIPGTLGGELIIGM